ncbi:hypothetical protein Tco_0915776 [Tanacetum coccineum]
MLGSSSTHPTLSHPNLALRPCISDLLALSTSLLACGCATAVFIYLILSFSHQLLEGSFTNCVPFQRLRLHPLSKIIDCYNDEFEFSEAFWERSKDVNASLVEWPW